MKNQSQSTCCCRKPDMNRADTIRDLMEGAGVIKCQALTLGPMISISETLAGLVRGMLGPCCQQTLLSTHTGQVLVTRDGRTVVSSLHLAHPVARCIMQSLATYHALHCDGSKTFVLYLAQMLKAIGHHLEQEGTNKRSKSCRIKLSVELNQFVRTDFQHIAKLLLKRIKSCSTRREGEDNFVSKVKAVLKTSLNTCLQKHLAAYFTEFLNMFLDIESKEPSNLEQRLSHILQHFDMYHTKVSTQPQQKSRICAGILFEADLKSVCQTQAGAISAKNKRFALMDIDLGDDEKQNGGNTVFIQPSSESLADFFSYRRNCLKRVLTGLRAAGLDVLLCAETVPQYVMGMCREEGIALHCLHTEKLVFLQSLTGVPVLKDLNQEALREFIFEADVHSFVHVGSKVCTLICLSEKCQTASPFKHMVVCAPTEGLCDQLCRSLFKALKAVHLCLRPYDWGSADVAVRLNASACNTSACGETHDNSVASLSEFVSLTDTSDSAVSIEDNTCFGSKTMHDGVRDNGPGSGTDKACDKDSVCVHSSSTRCFSCSVLAISSGGTFEAVLCTTITELYASEKFHPNERVGALVQMMLMSVPKALHANLSSAGNGQQRQFSEKWTSLLMMAQRGRLMGFDAHGDVCDVTQSCHLEPVASKLTIVEHVLQLVIQLLRVEALVPVKKLPEADSSGDDEEPE